MNNIRIDPACVGTPNERIGCDLGYKSHATVRSNRQVKCRGSMNFRNNRYRLNCKPNTRQNITCNFSTNLDFTPAGKRHLTNRRYKKKRWGGMGVHISTICRT